MSLVDQPRAVRRGEELDKGRVEAYIRETLPDLPGEVTVSQFPGGHSNLTYFVGVGGRELVLRRPPFGTKAKSAHDMSREYRVLSAIHPVFPYAPQPLAFCEDESVMGCPFYLMERFRGIVVRKEFPPELGLTEKDVRQVFLNLIDVQVELHSVDYRAVGLEDFGRPQGYVERQVGGWSKRYRNARTPDAPDCENTMAWLIENMPPESDRPGIIHNDFKLDNVVLDPKNPTRIIGVLDWEMATLGDPLMDLGSSLAYYIQADDPDDLRQMRLMPTDAPGAVTRREMIEIYTQKTGLRMEHLDFYYVFGLFRLGAISQQIYYRYYHKQTRDERFKAMIIATKMLDRQARRVMDGANW